MSTLEEFENAPVGATATEIADGKMAVKTPNKEWPWSLFARAGERIANANDHHMATQGYTLNPTAGPATAREALDLAWNLAHPVTNGQVIPEGAEYIRRYDDGTCTHFIAGPATNAVSKWDEHHTRFLDPLPDPTPDWLDAPAVLARIDEWDSDEPEVFTPAHEVEGHWVARFSALSYHWSELRDVTPLYPKGQDA